MVELKGKTSILLLAALASCLIIAPSVKAFPMVGIYGYVDEIQYSYGEAGTLSVWIMNTGTDPLILHNISIFYPWHEVIPWEGNETLEDLDAVIPIDGNLTYTFAFVVPDNRGALGSGSIQVTAVTDKITRSGWISMNIANPPVNMALENMNNLVTLITVEIIITIVAAIIIAAAIFLSWRKPGVPA